jgi:hypothetical protein
MRDIAAEQAEAVSRRVNADPEAACLALRARAKRFPVLGRVMNTLANAMPYSEQAAFLTGYVAALELLEEANPPLGIGLDAAQEVEP